MKSYSPEPLTPEERELAKLSAHLGPQGEPSPALDARILSAAHAALERTRPAARRKPRWPVAMGLAASVVFAVAIAWQLRPLQQAPMPVSAEAPADEAAEQPAMAATIPGSPALPEAEMAADTASAEAVAAPAPAEQAPPAPLKALASPPPAEFRAPPPRQQIARAKTRASNAGRQAQSTENAATASVPPPPPAPPAPAAMTAATVAETEAPAAFAPEPRERESHAYLARGVAADNSRTSAGAAAAKPQAEALAEAKAARAAASTRQKESATLDRVEVTGSRMKRTDLQVPVSDDARLPVNEWLERVRTRYGLGDAGAAKQSLLLFVKDHPSEPVPGDLEPLLEE